MSVDTKSLVARAEELERRFQAAGGPGIWAVAAARELRQAADEIDRLRERVRELEDKLIDAEAALVTYQETT